MKTQLTVSLMVLSLMSCHILKKDKQTLRKLNQKEEIQLLEHRHTLSLQRQLVLTDSSHNDYTLWLWPKGKFSFSVANGFEGEAEKMLIKGKQTNLINLHVNQETKQDSAVLKANQVRQEERSTEIYKNKKRITSTWIWILILPLLYVVYSLSKRLR